MTGLGLTAVAVAGVLGVLFVFALVWSNRYTKVGPNEVLIISGRRRQIAGPDGTSAEVGYRIVKGGGAFVFPVLEKANVLSLELLTLDVRLPEVYSVTGVPVTVDGVAQIKVKGDDVAIATAAEQFLSKNRDDIMNIALQTLEGHLRAIIGTMTIEEIYKNREIFAQRVQEVAARDMANMGMVVVSFTLRDIRDSQGYLEALGKPHIAAVKRDAIIAQAEADRDATIRSAQANQTSQQAKVEADTQIALYERDFDLRRAEYQLAVNEKKAEADLAYDLQKLKVQQRLKEEEVQVSLVEKEKLIEVQGKEIARKERELEAQVIKPADAEKYRIQAMADAERYRTEACAEAKRFQTRTEAEGEADAARSLGSGEADATKARGLAQADVTRATGEADGAADRARGLANASVTQARGEAEAAAMAKKTDAWQAYNQAAVLQTLLERMPEIAAAVSAPLAKTEKIVVVNSGGEGGAGASKVTRDVADIIAQVPTVIEALSGVDLHGIIAGVPGLCGNTPEPEAEDTAA